MKKIFVCSPYAGNPSCLYLYKDHLEIARKISKVISLEGNIPIAPHLIFPQFLDDTNKKERNLGIKYGLELLKMCDEIFVYRACCGISKGMKIELEEAKKLGIPITYYQKFVG